MTEYYSSIGEAIGTAMAHNIRLAHRSLPTASVDAPAHATSSGPDRGALHEGRLPTLDSDINRADHYGVDVVIFHWERQSIRADTRTGINEAACEVFEELGFVEVSAPGLTSHELTADGPWPVHQAHCTAAAGALASAGFTVILDPDLDTDLQVPDVIARYRPSLPDAAALTSPAAAGRDTAHTEQSATPVPPTATSPIHRTR
ncbi:hypothetical protein [Actinacidiphila paucisporea]|uniref:Uncharacterized protein n=1 Tax=Actinacidiphila paucisporea TaxID=310782 RepID=A0A1M7PZ14_9ACTN|nr:hypothetical protein [Actinacidiphila paucisporea]SHN23019.1 hypothetical protein SAMN05216499_12766 [Actinacidiphila paucisporea]